MSAPSDSEPRSTETSAPPEPARSSPLTSRRSLTQLGLCGAGIVSIALSTIVARRAVFRHHVRHSMQMFQPSNRSIGQRQKSENVPLAVEALQIATLNLASWTVMFLGGMSWAFDISSLDELRRYTRRHTRGDPDQTDEEVEEQFQAELAQLMTKYMSNTQVESLLQRAIEEKRAAAEAESSSSSLGANTKKG
ncbi:hypothetical protein MKZ38_000131 [Zalerion maritima]|uniref:Altered inheritance of mitochondria protein 11 n=1 Tax=Zalerion maritima TaxID=339359 RepID=A0AAD5S026_9PEZI|nr:hypothetical protein MKZ38_000131 [Zalerion maritima]